MGEAARDLPAVLTIDEAAAHCRVSPDVLYRLAAAGEFPARKVGGQWRITLKVLEAWLESSDAGAESSTSTPVAERGGRRSRGAGGAPSASPSPEHPAKPRTASRRSGSPLAASTRARLLSIVKGG